MEIFKDFVGRLFAVNPNRVDHATLVGDHIEAAFHDQLRSLFPLDGETVDQAWARLTHPLYYRDAGVGLMEKLNQQMQSSPWMKSGQS